MYSAFGGIRSVAITDIIQFLILAIGIPIIANLSFQALGSIDSIFSDLPHQYTQIKQHMNYDKYIIIFLFYSLPFTMLEPQLVQRYLMLNNPKQISQITYLFVFVAAALALMSACIAFTAIQIFPDIEPNFIIPKVINDFIPIGLRGIAMAGVIAVIMSTADSVLNTSGIIITLTQK